jgi:peptide/nickel transport system permease protein
MFTKAHPESSVGIIPNMKLFLRLFRSNQVLIGTSILVVVIALASLAPFIAPNDPLELNIFNRLLRPSIRFPFGTDEFGRCVMSRIIYGSRTSIVVGASVVIMATILGTVLGTLSGYYSFLDNPTMRLMDALMAFPSILLALAIIAALGPSQFNAILAITIVSLPRIGRVVRGSVLQLREAEFVEAAKAVGVSDLRLITKHILPNCLAPLIVTSTFTFASAVLTETGLSFLGLGTPPPTPSWGSILAEGRTFIRTGPWIMLSAGSLVMLTVVGLNLLGDGLRDVLDPTLRQP